MAQKLLLPFKKQRIICGYKVAIYAKPKPIGHGYVHYGVDITSQQGYDTNNKNDHIIYSSGEGLVVVCERDTTHVDNVPSLGMAIAILYKDCVSHDGQVKDLIVRYMHSKDALVKLGDKVSKNTPIAVEGFEGTESYHCHYEIDTDTNYPKYSPQVAKGHTGWIHGTDTTLNPSKWLWQSADRVQDPYRDDLWYDDWINAEDRILPVVSNNSSGNNEELEKLKSENKSLKVRIVQLEERLASITKAIEDIISKYS